MNNFGFRDEDFHVKKSKGVRRIALLGDSIGMGWGVFQNNTLDKKMERELKDQTMGSTEVYNFSVNAIDTEAELRILKKKVLQFNPDHILVLWYLNDCGCQYFDGLTDREVRDYNLKMKSFEATTPQNSKWQEKMYHFSNLYRITAKKISILFSKDDFKDKAAKQFWCSTENPCFPKMFGAMEAMQDYSQKRSIPFTVVMVPELVEFDDYPYKKQYSTIENTFKKSGMDVLNLLDFMKPYQTGRQFWVHRYDHHPNADFLSIIAKIISHDLESRYPEFYSVER